MIGHCYQRAKMSSMLEEVYVATPDQEIFDFIVAQGGKCIMTSVKHERASDRVSEAMINIESELNSKIETVVMLQGDELYGSTEYDRLCNSFFNGFRGRRF